MKKSPIKIFRCDGLDYEHIKIVDSKSFCLNSEYKMKVSKSSVEEYQYIKVNNKKLEECQKIVEIINTCSENERLFPYSDPLKCVNYKNPMYFCTSLNNYTKSDSEDVKYFLICFSVLIMFYLRLDICR